MSAKTWMAEFYPTPASSVSVEGAAAHSLKKWEGLQKSELKRHETSLSSLEANGFHVDGFSCALCVHHYKSEEGWESCKTCPLAIVRDGTPCERRRLSEDDSPWGVWCATGDPEPMILWLKKAVAQEFGL